MALSNNEQIQETINNIHSKLLSNVAQICEQSYYGDITADELSEDIQELIEEFRKYQKVYVEIMEKIIDDRQGELCFQ